MQDLKSRKWIERRVLSMKYLTRPALFILLGVLLISATFILVRKGTEALASHNTSSVRPPPISPSAELFPIACSLLPAAKKTGNSLYACTADGTSLRYSINSDFQQGMQSYLDSKQPPYALFIAIEPSTGRIIAINSASNDPAWNIEATYRIFPMASLFKMVTAAAALENARINPSTEMAYRGKAISENPKNWDPHPKGASHQISMTEAMGRSVNPVYGKVASDLLGKGALSATCSNFGFNRPLLSGIPVQTSRADVPETVHGLRLMGSGLDHELKVSPLHAAAITAAFANNGVMMYPRLVDSITKDGKESQTAPRELVRIVQPAVADDLTRMLLTTVTTGTSGKAFRTQDGRRLIKAMKIAAKTGTINGDNPAGQHTWFAAYAPADKPRIAVLALIINDGRWKIKASNVGEHALVTYFKPEIDQIPIQAVVLNKKTDIRKKSRAKNSHHQVARKKNDRSSRQGKGG